MALVLCTGSQQVNTGCFNTGMTQHISQLYNVLAGFVKDGGKQMPKVVRKYFGWSHTRMFTKPFQFRPDLSAGQFLSAFGAKNRAGGGFLFFLRILGVCGTVWPRGE